MSTDQREATADTVAAWLLYVVQLAFELLLLLFLGLSVMAGDACGTGGPDLIEPRICSGTYFASLFYGYGLVLLIAAVVVPVLIVRAGRRRRLRWLRPVLAMVVLAVLFVAYMALLTL